MRGVLGAGVLDALGRTLAAAALLALSGALALPATAQADVLVSNLGQDLSDDAHTSTLSDRWLGAQAFSVPSGGSDYALTSIEIPFEDNGIAATDIDSLSVSVWSASSSGHPSSSLYTLTNPASIMADTTATFNAPANSTLDAGDTYVVVVHHDKEPAFLGANSYWQGTSSDDEDATSTTGWTIANKGLYRENTATSWSDRSYAHGIRVNGTVVSGGTPANNPPVFSPTSTTREVAENSVAGTNVGAVIPAATDADSGDTLTYSMEGTDVASFAFDASTRQITTITGVDLNHEATKNSYSVTVKVSDGTASATIAVTIAVTDVAEKSAKPDKPTLAAVAGSSTSLTATWTKPDLNGGPDIATYDVAYRERPSGGWEDFGTFGVGLTTTITGLTADTSYQARVRTANDEALSDWSDASDAVKTNVAVTLPTLSIGNASATEGSTIDFPLTLSAAASGDVTVACTASFESGDTAVAADLSSTNLTTAATITAGGTSGRCSFLSAQDTTDEEDETFTVTLSGVSSNAQLAADPTATGTINDDDATAPTISTVTVTSTPVLETDTYGAGETIEVSVTFSEAVTATSDTDFELNVGGGSANDKSAPLLRGSGTATLVFGYTVASSDEDDRGIWIGDQDRTLVGARRLMAQSGTIASVANSTAADLTHAEVGVQTGHKVDGSRTAVSVAVTSTPVLETDTYGAGETIEVSVTFSEAVTATSDTDFELNVSGDRSAPLLRGSGTATLVFGYTVVSSDADDNGIWIGDQDRTLVGNRRLTAQSGTITSVATSEAAGQPVHAELGTQTGHKVDGSRTTVNTGLSGITVNGTSIPGFLATDYAPQYGVSATTTTAAIVATAASASASVSYSDADDMTVDANNVTLSAGANTVIITVTDGSDSTPYTLGVNRAVTTQYGWKADSDFDTLKLADIDDPRGIWYDEDTATVYVCNYGNDKVYAYNLDGTRDSGKDIDVSDHPNGIWSDGTTLWVADSGADKLFAYTLSSRAANSGEDFDTLNAADNDDPRGLFSDRTTMWVSDGDDKKVYAYKMSDKSRDADKDFDTLDAAGNDAPFGIWSDGTTMWVSDRDDSKLYAYKMSDKSRDADKDFATLDDADNNDPRGLWSDGSVLWTTDSEDDKLYAYNLVEASTPTCTLNTGDLWCGVVTVERFTLEVIELDGFGSGEGEGDLSDTDFTYGSNSYTIDLAANERNNEALLFSLTSALTDADLAALELHVDGNSNSFAFAAADGPSATTYTYTWTGTGLDWFGTPTVTLRLREANNPPVFSPTSTTREVAENSAAGTDVGAVIPAATDADSGDTLTYSMEGTDAASFAFDASTRQITTITGVDLNHEATKNSYSVTVKAVGQHGQRHHRGDDQRHGRQRAIGQAGQADAGGGHGLVDDPDRALDEAGPERRPGHHRLQGGIPAGQPELAELPAQRHGGHHDHHRADGEHGVPGAGAGQERRDGQRLVGRLGRGAHE